MKDQVKQAVKNANLEINIYELGFVFSGEIYSNENVLLRVKTDDYIIKILVNVEVKFYDSREYDFFDIELWNLALVDNKGEIIEFKQDVKYREEILNLINVL